MSLNGAEFSVICDDCHETFIGCVRKEKFQSIEGTYGAITALTAVSYTLHISTIA